VARDVIRAAATALAVLLLAQLVEASTIDLGDRLATGSLALALVGVGLGVLVRTRVARAAAASPRARTLAVALVALLAPLRGALCELLLRWPGAASSVPARLAIAAVTLGPPSLLVGWLLGAPARGGLPLVIAGVVGGEALVWAGATGWLSAWIAGAAVAVALAGLDALDESRRSEAGEAPVPASALLLGGAAALLVDGLARLVPAYVTPSSFAGTDALAALLAPAALVAWPASRLGRGKAARAVMGGGGALLLAVALFHAVDALSLYLEPTAVVSTTRKLHVEAARWSPWLDEWWLWLLSFAAFGAAALGLAVSILPARAAGALACGAGAALLVRELVPLDPVRAPASWLLVASVLAAAAAPPILLGRHGWWLSPLAVGVLMASPVERRPGYDDVRRPGELSVEGFQRTPLLDVALYSSAASPHTSIEGRVAQRTTFSCDRPAIALGPDGELLETAEAEGSCLGLRLGGIAWQPGHDPLGANGSVGRLTRLLAPKGRALVAGPCAELLVADLHDAGLLESATVASDAPLGRLALVILAACGSGAWMAASVVEPLTATREAGGYDTILLAPTRAGWPGDGLASEETLERIAERLTAAGRCLLWLDTTDLDPGALRARLAAFGQVFGARAAAFVEPRELDPPLVLLVGWRLDAARPTAEELGARLAAMGGGAEGGGAVGAAGGRRLPLRGVGDLDALLLRDGAGLAAAGDEWRELRASNLEPTSRWSTRGWAAVAAVADRAARLESVVAGAEAQVARSGAVYEGLATHAGYDYDLADINETILEVRPDVDWAAFDREAAFYAQAGRETPDDPLLQHALASLLEPLALSGDYGRFAKVFEATGARSMRNVRLAVLEAYVQRHSLEEEAAQAALARAREWAAR
jgi:hypothetical protein